MRSRVLSSPRAAAARSSLGVSGSRSRMLRTFVRADPPRFTYSRTISSASLCEGGFQHGAAPVVDALIPPQDVGPPSREDPGVPLSGPTGPAAGLRPSPHPVHHRLALRGDHPGTTGELGRIWTSSLGGGLLPMQRRSPPPAFLVEPPHSCPPSGEGLLTLEDPLHFHPRRPLHLLLERR